MATNLGGGTHHAFADAGRGFCVFNDVVTALRALRADGPGCDARSCVDLDVHQGDGTHALLAGDADAFTLSINGFRNYPFRRVPGDLELDLPDETGGRRVPRGTRPPAARRRCGGRDPSSASTSPAPIRTRETGSAASR